MAVAKACCLTALEEMQLPVTPSALVIGGGLAGMTAALTIADQGFAVTLIERGTQLGGKAMLLTADRHGKDPRQAVQEVIARVNAHPKITMHTEAQVTAVSGYVGNFTTTVESKGASAIIHHGVTVLATGEQSVSAKPILLRAVTEDRHPDGLGEMLGGRSSRAENGQVGGDDSVRRLAG